MTSKVLPIPEGYHTVTPFVIVKDVGPAQDAQVRVDLQPGAEEGRQRDRLRREQKLGIEPHGCSRLPLQQIRQAGHDRVRQQHGQERAKERAQSGGPARA